MTCDQVLPEVLIGSCPDCPADIDRLKQDCAITAVLSLQTDEDIGALELDWSRLQTRYRQVGIVLRRIPVRDFDPHDLQQKLPPCVLALGQLLQAGHTVYVHCTAGAGRSPNVVIAYLHWVKGWDLGRATDHVCRCRPCAPNWDAIRRAAGEFLLLKDPDQARQDRP